MQIKINESLVKSVRLPASGYVLLWDTELKGFGLRVTAEGARSFVVQRRIKRRDRRSTLGRWPALKAEQARKNAQAWLGAIASGRDPIAEREREKLCAVTLEQAFKDYVELRRRSKDGKALKERTKADMLAALDEAFSDWKRKPLVSILRPMVEKRYKERADRSVARANNAVRYLRAVFNFTADRSVDAEGRPLILDNPTRVLRKQMRAVGRKKRVITPSQLPKWLTAVQGLAEAPQREQGTGKQHPKLKHGEVFRNAFLFVALTGCRPSEMLVLERDDVDLEADTVTFRDPKNRTDHVLPLTPYLHDLLERRLVDKQGERVFCSPHDGRAISNARCAMARVKEVSGVEWSYSDLRRTAATAMEHAAVPRYTLKAVLNHLLSDSDDVTAGYVQVSNEMKLKALLRIEDYVFGRVGKVVQFPGRAEAA